MRPKSSAVLMERSIWASLTDSRVTLSEGLKVVNGLDSESPVTAIIGTMGLRCREGFWLRRL